MLAEQVADNLRRLDAIDASGTRGVAVLAVQVQEVAKDVATLAKDVEAHDQRHEQEKRDRLAGRRWLVAAAITLVGVIDGPIVTVLLARGH